MATAATVGPTNIFAAGATDAASEDYVAASVAFNGSLNKAFGGGIVETAVNPGYGPDWPTASAVEL